MLRGLVGTCKSQLTMQADRMLAYTICGLCPELLSIKPQVLAVNPSVLPIDSDTNTQHQIFDVHQNASFHMLVIGRRRSTRHYVQQIVASCWS